MSTLDDLMAALGGIPRLPGARCRARHDMFDQYDDPGIVEAAIAICHSCPALPACKTWCDSLPPRQRPAGVVAGQVSGTQREERAS